MVLIKSAIVAILLLQLLVLNIRIVNSIEDNEIVFDVDGPTSNDRLQQNNHASENHTGFLERIKRSFSDWFTFGLTTTEVSASTEPPKSATVSHHREIRNSEEENDEDNDVLNKKEKNNDEINLGKIAAGKLGSRLVGNTDDEDLVGSGEAEGSATDETKPDPTHETESRQARFYRATLTVNEPYRTEYADTNSQDYITLSGNLTQSLKELLSLRIPNFDHVANVVQISPTEDSFNSQVTVDIGSTYPHENEIRQILEDQLHFHALGNIQIEPTGFTFRSIQDTTPECVAPTSLKCRDGSCIQLNYRCDGIAQCPDQSDELDCPVTAALPSREDDLIVYTNNCRGDDTVRCSDGSRDICSVQLCDGVPDCDDHGDEHNCGGPSCSENEFSCDVSRCVLDKDRCNFIQDCEDGSDERGCKYPACTQNEFRCRNGQCINSRYRCNGATECYDKSDELNCPPSYCLSGQFRCNDGHCIDGSLHCDGRSDCSDRSDERNCPVTTCNSDQFRCTDGTCVSIDKRCNNINDCRNGEDESQCGCGATDFRCKDGQCIAYQLQCDGSNDCRDGSDEHDQCGLAPCPIMDFTCGDGSCISQSSVCDGIDDCPRAEDELNCDRGCTPTQFKCATGGKCIEDIYRCDGHPDCPDRSDENCGVDNTSNSTITHITYPHHPPTSHTNLPVEGRVTERPVECNTARTEMRCGDGKCISLRRKCDGIPDCLDNSDERDCGKCGINEWRCISGECLRENLRCDGRAHCRDGSDEANCVNKCPTGMFRCNDGICLDQRRRCDGRPHCRDGSDEINCKNTSCPEGQLPCANGICISKQFFCDRHVDCHDGSDETNCSETSQRPSVKECNNYEYTCRDRSCIPLSAKCDGRPDCPYNEDEQDCHILGLDATSHKSSTTMWSPGSMAKPEDNVNLTSSKSCAVGNFVCADGTCIPVAHRCDNFYDCRDFTDEQFCFG